MGKFRNNISKIKFFRLEGGSFNWVPFLKNNFGIRVALTISTYLIINDATIGTTKTSTISTQINVNIIDKKNFQGLISDENKFKILTWGEAVVKMDSYI